MNHDLIFLNRHIECAVYDHMNLFDSPIGDMHSFMNTKILMYGKIGSLKYIADELHNE